jgi:hypothetical protein
MAVFFFFSSKKITDKIANRVKIKLNSSNAMLLKVFANHEIENSVLIWTSDACANN